MCTDRKFYTNRIETNFVTKLKLKYSYVIYDMNINDVDI